MPRWHASFKKKKKYHGGNQYSQGRPSPTAGSRSETLMPKEQIRPCQTLNALSSGKKLSFDNFAKLDTSGADNCIFDFSLLFEVKQKFVKCTFFDGIGCVQFYISTIQHIVA